MTATIGSELMATEVAPAEDRLDGKARIAVVGCGHVGLIMSTGLAKLGHHVIGIDKDPRRVEQLTDGDVPIHEPELDDLVAEGLASGRLSFTTAFEDAVPTADFIFLAVDTPRTLGGAADLRNIRAASRSIASTMNGRSPIIINKSTSPIGTGETIEGIIADALEEHEKAPRIVSNPEFLRQGRAVWDFFHPDRIVVGARSAADARAVAELYDGLGGEVIVTDLRTAEMIKYVANSYLATRISFINEIARLCEYIGVDVDTVIDGISRDPRIGRQFLQPGIGYGGSCLPKDVAALRYIGETFGVATPVLSAVQEINQGQKTGAVRRLRSRLGTLEGKTVAVWGMTFKAGTEDTRESPALEVLHLTMNEGARVQAYDPAVARYPDVVREELRPLLRASALEAARGADALAILTDWPEFRDVPLAELREAMNGIVIFDGRNLLDRVAVEDAGFSYLGVGRIARRPNRRVTDR
jgi:UDPglucose 6-dehydrogenase